MQRSDVLTLEKSGTPIFESIWLRAWTIKSRVLSTVLVRAGIQSVIFAIAGNMIGNHRISRRGENSPSRSLSGS